MKKKWLNLVLYLTNRVYRQKQSIVERSGLAAVANVISLMILEIILGVVSLPLYLTLKPEKVTAYLADKETYAKVSFDYNLRRILTVTGVGLVALIWAIKLLLILTLPLIYGPLPLYYVTNLQPVDILNQQLITTETGIQTARIIGSRQKPVLSEVRKSSRGDYAFLGKGLPNTTVVLLLSGNTTVIYTGTVDKNGGWQIDHKQSNFKLSEGNNSIVIFDYDAKLGVRSETAPEQYFKVTTSWYDYFIKNIDSLVNWLVIIIVFAGIFLIFLTI